MGYSKDQVKQAVCSAIDRHREKVIALGENILHNPELGFKEIETARLVAQTLRELGLEPREGLALTGVKAIAGGRPGPAVAIIGEMDALINYDYPFSNPQTGAAHCCGHHAQVASMLGSAIGLLESGAMAYLAGSVVFFAVPAEEFIEIEYRLHLR
ncbi:MAG: amidohydrolase, partial [Chloroflexi bacterium]|nr:amidohydrolase [Chloroflexota bacterium]